MRSQGDGELVQHRKTDQNKEDVDEDEDEEYGVRRSVKKLDPREPGKEEREKSTKKPTCRFAIGADTASEGEAKRRLAETPRGIRMWRRCTWTSCSWEMKAMTGRWRCWW